MKPLYDTLNAFYHAIVPASLEPHNRPIFLVKPFKHHYYYSVYAQCLELEKIGA